VFQLDCYKNSNLSKRCGLMQLAEFAVMSHGLDSYNFSLNKSLFAHFESPAIIQHNVWVPKIVSHNNFFEYVQIRQRLLNPCIKAQGE